MFIDACNCCFVCMHGCTDVRMYGCTDVRMYGCTDVRMHMLVCNICKDVQLYG